MTEQDERLEVAGVALTNLVVNREWMAHQLTTAAENPDPQGPRRYSLTAQHLADQRRRAELPLDVQVRHLANFLPNTDLLDGETVSTALNIHLIDAIKALHKVRQNNDRSGLGKS